MSPAVDAQEKAYHLARRMHAEPGFNKTNAPWWGTQPGPQEIFAMPSMTAEHSQLLQSRELVRYSCLLLKSG